jgi:phosphopantothenoylcysteine decarboxylase/phosphopantothenate--cysteine ligase
MSPAPTVPKGETVARKPVTMGSGDRSVERRSESLSGYKVLLGICGGIAAVDSVRLLRELRRHGADATVIMSYSAQRVISPLAVEWAAGVKPVTEWGAGMAQLEPHDAVLVAPATRRCLAAHVHGVLDTPLQMALSAARGRRDPIMFVPSMHDDLFDDPVTDDLCQAIVAEGASVVWGNREEGRYKTPDAVQIVADLCHLVNSRRPERRRVVVTLGRNRSRVDAVRWITNSSTGRTGWAIAEHLYRMGHSVDVVSGEVTSQPAILLPSIIYADDPEDMLGALLDLAASDNAPTAWVHAAAVLDYVVSEPESKKVASGAEQWGLGLVRSTKHLDALTALCGDCCRIAFKLESGVSDDQLIESARSLLQKHDLDGVVANHLEEVSVNTGRRGLWVSQDSEPMLISSLDELAELIESSICG